MGLTSKRISTDGLLDSPQEASTNNSPEIPKLASQRWNQQQRESLPQLKCPRCDSTSTKFCYYNNYSQSQPRYFCRACRRHWTHGGSLRYVPVGGCRRSKHPKTTDPTTATTTSNNTSKESIFDSNETLIPQQQQQVPVPLGGESGSGIFSDILREVLLNPTPVLPASDYIASSSFENHMLSPPFPFLVDLFGKEPLSSYDEIVDSFPMPPSSSSSSLSNVSAPDSITEDGFISADSSRTKKRRAPPSYMNGDGVLGSSPSYWNFWDDITGFVSFNGP